MPKKYTAQAFITILHEEHKGLDGNYYLTTTGCGCCNDYGVYTKEEYIILLKEMKKLIEDEIDAKS